MIGDNWVPEPDRPFIEGYGIPTHREGLLSWEYVVERMKTARNYWIATTRPDGRPHARPVWGVWVEGTLHFGGGPNTRWARNLAANPHVVVHLESGDEVVIVEGAVTQIAEAENMRHIDAAYLAKYDMEHGPPVWRLQPTLAFAWTEFPTTTTRWQFE